MNTRVSRVLTVVGVLLSVIAIGAADRHHAAE